MRPSSSYNGKPPLSQAYGYGIILGLGFSFALGMILTTWLLKRYHNEAQTSEQFTTAGRVVKKGLVASAVVSSWTWAATLLQSSGIAYRYGVSGPFWYASGATVQILLFAALAIELKRRAPNAHTFLEAIRARYGFYCHVVFIFFALMTNVLVTSMLLTGGSAVVGLITGMPTPAACFLLPVGVILYTLFGGIKATFLTDYLHTVTIIIILFVFAFTTWSNSALLGSPGKVYDLLIEASHLHPVEGNAQGSYLTMKSSEGAMFFVINVIGNFGTVFMDNGYYNKAIAASPVSALPGYIIGGLAWFAIPWLAATTMGLACISLENNPAFPTYPNRMTDTDVTAGLVLPMAAVTLLGQGGAVACLILIFMAVTSASSAELIAVSSIVVFDCYQTYLHPLASDKTLIRLAHFCVVAYGFAMAGFATALFYIGISMGWLYLVMGIVVSPAVVPAVLTLLWKKQNPWAAMISPILGLVCSITTFLVVTKVHYGTITIETTGNNIPMLWGNLVGLLSPAIFSPLLSYIIGFDDYDWLSMQTIQLVQDYPSKVDVDVEVIRGEVVVTNRMNRLRVEQAHLLKVSKSARKITIAMTLVFLIVWPMPFFGSAYIFSRPFFTGWVIIAIVWLFASFCLVGIYPLYESRKPLWHVIVCVYKDLTGGRRPHMEDEDSDGIYELHMQQEIEGVASATGRQVDSPETHRSSGTVIEPKD